MDPKTTLNVDEHHDHDSCLLIRGGAVTTATSSTTTSSILPIVAALTNLTDYIAATKFRCWTVLGIAILIEIASTTLLNVATLEKSPTKSAIAMIMYMTRCVCVCVCVLRRGCYDVGVFVFVFLGGTDLTVYPSMSLFDTCTNSFRPFFSNIQQQSFGLCHLLASN